VRVGEHIIDNHEPAQTYQPPCDRHIEECARGRVVAVNVYVVVPGGRGGVAWHKRIFDAQQRAR
jgi:hypothetical protein